MFNDVVRLAGCRLPDARISWPQLHTIGFSAVVCLCSDRVYPCAPLELAVAVELDDLVDGGPPMNPTKETAAYHELTRVVRRYLDDGTGVLVHCAGGRGRTGTMLDCVALTYGHAAEDVIAWLDEVHRLRGKPGWPESPWQAEVLRSFAPMSD